jgi:transposase
MADEGYSNKDIVKVLKITRPTVNRTRKRYCQEGLDSAINDKPRSGAPPKIDGTIEAQVTLLACSKPPEGKSTWTLKLLADKLVEMEVVESISTMSIQRILKKAKPSLGRRLDGVLAR